MKFGEYEIKLNPLGWLAVMAAAAAKAGIGGKGFRTEREKSSGEESFSRKEEKTDMAYALRVYIVNPDDEQIYVEHVFYGETKADAERVKKEHLASCEYFRAAEAEGRTDEEGEEISADDWPSVEEEGEEVE